MEHDRESILQYNLRRFKEFLIDNWITVTVWLLIILTGSYFFGSDPEFWDGLLAGGRN